VRLVIWKMLSKIGTKISKTFCDDGLPATLLIQVIIAKKFTFTTILWW
jgi:hypothetical protein